jgi:hypothetical protein
MSELREATQMARRLMRSEISGVRSSTGDALARLRKALEDGQAMNGLRTALETASNKLDEVHGILQRVEAEHFHGDRT